MWRLVRLRRKWRLYIIRVYRRKRRKRKKMRIKTNLAGIPYCFSYIMYLGMLFTLSYTSIHLRDAGLEKEVAVEVESTPA
jgi:hypothetical protein